MSTTVLIPQLTVEEEDAIIHARITNDERPLRRVIKKFHNYASIAHEPIVPGGAGVNRTTVEDAREAFIVELESFHLSLKKSVMICEAEARQVEEYLREKQRIDDEHGKLVGQIDQLKTALEHEQTIRKRKIEYDLIAEKVNALPNREELERTIKISESDMEAIRIEQDRQTRIIQSQKSALDAIVSDLTSLRFVGKEQDVTSHAASPAPDLVDLEVTDGSAVAGTGTPMHMSVIGDESGEIHDTVSREDDRTSTDDSLSTSLNHMGNRSHGGDDDDIEMGELAEDPRDKGKRKREDLEEGETSDSSSALSEPPED